MELLKLLILVLVVLLFEFIMRKVIKERRFSPGLKLLFGVMVVSGGGVVIYLLAIYLFFGINF